MKKMIPGGFFITFEGGEKAGKSTQIKLLAERLKKLDYDVLETREPGGTAFCEKLRHLVMNYKDEKIVPEAELLLFGASRAQLVYTILRPHLQKGGIVLCDRFADSTTAYQGEARGLDKKFIAEMHQFTIGKYKPNLTILLDLAPEESWKRQQQMVGTADDDRFEIETRLFHSAVREGFLELAEKYPERIKLFDATLTVEQLSESIWEKVQNAIH